MYFHGQNENPAFSWKTAVRDSVFSYQDLCPHKSVAVGLTFYIVRRIKSLSDHHQLTWRVLYFFLGWRPLRSDLEDPTQEPINDGAKPAGQEGPHQTGVDAS